MAGWIAGWISWKYSHLSPARGVAWAELGNKDVVKHEKIKVKNVPDKGPAKQSTANAENEKEELGNSETGNTESGRNGSPNLSSASSPPSSEHSLSSSSNACFVYLTLNLAYFHVIRTRASVIMFLAYIVTSILVTKLLQHLVWQLHRYISILVKHTYLSQLLRQYWLSPIRYGLNLN